MRIIDIVEYYENKITMRIIIQHAMLYKQKYYISE